jgi:hypothetical protein
LLIRLLCLSSLFNLAGLFLTFITFLLALLILVLVFIFVIVTLLSRFQLLLEVLNLPHLVLLITRFLFTDKLDLGCSCETQRCGVLFEG